MFNFLPPTNSVIIIISITHNSLSPSLFTNWERRRCSMDHNLVAGDKEVKTCRSEAVNLQKTPQK